MTMWFDSIVASATEATITIDVADEKPPRKASRASPSCPSVSGRVRTKRSGFAPACIRASPVAAIGTTKMHIAIR